MMPSHFKSIKFLLGFIIFLTIFSPSYSKSFLIANFDSVYKPAAKIIAILPVAHSLTKEDGQKAAAKMRASIFDEMSKQQETYTLQIQRLEDTDSLLSAVGLSDSLAAQMTVPDLCKVLRVDVVMRTKILKYRKGLRSPFTGSFTRATTIPDRNSALNTEVSIYSGSDGQLLWNDKLEKFGKVFNEDDDIWRQTGKAIAKEFPYRRKEDEKN